MLGAGAIKSVTGGDRRRRVFRQLSAAWARAVGAAKAAHQRNVIFHDRHRGEEAGAARAIICEGLLIVRPKLGGDIGAAHR